MGETRRRTPVDVRLWRKVDKSGECWIWQGCVGPGGYGKIGTYRADGSHNVTDVHRVSFELAKGPIPAGMQVDHICMVKLCVRPDHLRLTTPKQNSENQVVRPWNKAGVRGVCWRPHANKYAVQVGHLGRTVHGGYFSTLEEAEAAAIALRNKLHTHNAQDRIARAES